MNSNFKFQISNFRGNKGFTIIELLVVVGVIVVITAVAITNFTNTKTQLALSRAAYKFAQDVSRAQKMALSSVPYKDSNGVLQSVNGYGIYVDFDIGALNITDGHHQYLLYVDKSPGDQTYASGDYLFDFIDLSLSEPGVIIKEIVNNSGGIAGQKSFINFSFPDASSSIIITPPGAPSQNNVRIVFTLDSDPTKTKTVFVNSSGLVEVQ